MIIHPDFKSDSPIQSLLESSSTDQLISDTSTSISEDQTHVVQPISVAQLENSLKATLDTLVSKPSILEPIRHPADNSVHNVSNMDISDSNDENERVI